MNYYINALYFFKQTGIYMCLYKEILSLFFAIHCTNNKADCMTAI